MPPTARRHIKAPWLAGITVILPPAMAITTRPMASHGRGSRLRNHIPAGAATAAATKVISEIVAPSPNGESLNPSPTQAAARTPAAIVLAGRTHSRPGTAPPPRRGHPRDQAL